MLSDPRKRLRGLFSAANVIAVAALTLIRHFPFGFRLEPIQARNVSYSNNLRLPRV